MTIESQIEALTQELRPYPAWERRFYYFDEISKSVLDHYIEEVWYSALFASTNKAEVEEYADCYRRLKLYQLLGKKAEKEFPLDWIDGNYGTDFELSLHDRTDGMVTDDRRTCVLGGVWFAREEDRLAALKICGIDKSFQERCSKYGLGGA